MRFLLITTALLFSGHAQSDNFWLCASDDDPRSVIVSLPEKGAAAVQVGGSNSNVLATFEEEVDDLKTVMSIVDNISSKNIRI
mgnify:CR=1 FL=1